MNYLTFSAAKLYHTCRKILFLFCLLKNQAAVKAVVASTRLGSASYHSSHDSNKLNENQHVSAEDDTEEKETSACHITQGMDIQEQGCEGRVP